LPFISDQGHALLSAHPMQQLLDLFDVCQAFFSYAFHAFLG